MSAREGSTWHRVHAATGIAFVAVSVFVLFVVPLPPAAGAPTSEMAAYYRDHGDRFLFGNYIIMLAFPLFLWFVGFLDHVLNQAGANPRPPPSALVLHAGSIYAAICFAIGGLAQTLPFRCADGSDLSIVRTVSDLMNLGLASTYIPAALLVGAASVSILRIVTLPRWVGVLGLIIMVVQLLGSLSLAARSGFLAAGGPFAAGAYVGFLVWILVVSIVLVVRGGGKLRA